MTSYTWGAQVPFFDDRELRRILRHLRLALAPFIDERGAGETWREERSSGRGGDDPAPGHHKHDDEQAVRQGEEPATNRSEHACRCGRHGACGHHHAAGAPFAGEATRDAWREAWREQARAWRRAMEAGDLAADTDAPWARSEGSRGRSSTGEGGRGRQRREEGSEGRERGGPRGSRRGGPDGEPGFWGPGRPFGPFGPFGPFPGATGGPGRGGRGRGPGWRFEGGRGRAGRGDVRLAILALLSEGPRHGYQLIQDITERSEGAWAPSPGSIYPALSALQDEGLIDDEKLDGRRVFTLTSIGRDYVRDRQEQIDAVFAQNSPTSEHEALAEVAALMWGVGEAALTVLGTGTELQRAEARALLARARRDLFRILAEDGAPAADAEPDAAEQSVPATDEPGEDQPPADPAQASESASTPTEFTDQPDETPES